MVFGAFHGLQSIAWSSEHCMVFGALHVTIMYPSRCVAPGVFFTGPISYGIKGMSYLNPPF